MRELQHTIGDQASCPACVASGYVEPGRENERFDVIWRRYRRRYRRNLIFQFAVTLAYGWSSAWAGHMWWPW